jgi:hypothetical protein
MSKGVLALVGTVAALLLAALYWTSGSSPHDDADPRVTRRQAGNDRAADAGAAREGRSGLRRSGESRDDSPRRRERSTGNDAASRQPGPGDSQSGSAAQTGSARRAAGTERRRPDGGDGIARPRLPRAEDGDRDLPELPEARDQQGLADDDIDAAEDVPEPPTEPIKEVAFESGPDRMFDTGVYQEVDDAGRISADGGMASFWIQPEWSHNREDSADLMRLGETGLQLLKEGSFLRFQYVDANGAEQGGDADIGQWQDGEWHHVIATWTGDAMYLYVDGGQAFANQGLTRPPAQSDPRLIVGSKFPEGTGIALAAMSDVNIPNRSASGEEVRKMFESGGPSRK